MLSDKRKYYDEIRKTRGESSRFETKTTNELSMSAVSSKEFEHKITGEVGMIFEMKCADRNTSKLASVSNLPD